MSESLEVGIRLALSLLALVVVVAAVRVRAPRAQLRLRGVVHGLAAVAALAYVNFGTLHGRGRLPHYWDQFNYVMGSKYFAELGYDGLYVASMGAEMQMLDDPVLQR